MIYKPYYTIGAKPGARQAFSLIEVIVSVSLFTVIILSSTGIFKMVIDSQRSALASQNVQESLKYFLEVTAKEIRMAQKNSGVCSGIGNEELFVIGSEAGNDTLSFKNYYGECVKYTLALDGDNLRFYITRNNNSGFISPSKISLDSLDFVPSIASANQQPVITINLQAHALGIEQARSEMTLQTSITSRYYK